MLSVITFPGLGISVDPSPVAFNVLGKDIYWYGIIIAFGFLVAYLYMNARCKQFGLSSDNLLDMLFWAIPLGIIGARAYYCIFYWEQYQNNPISVFYIWEGGLAIYGGVLAGLLGLFLCSKLQKRSFMAMGDLAAFGVIIGQIFGRWGNFINREAHGTETQFFLRMGLVDGDGVTRFYHPTFLYESLWNLVGLVILHFVSKKRKFDGQILLMYLLWYGLGRAWIEGLRTDSLYLFNTGVRVSQLLAMFFVIFAIAMLVYIFMVKKPDPAAMYVNRVAAAAAEAAETAVAAEDGEAEEAPAAEVQEEETATDSAEPERETAETDDTSDAKSAESEEK